MMMMMVVRLAVLFSTLCILECLSQKEDPTLEKCEAKVYNMFKINNVFPNDKKTYEARKLAEEVLDKKECPKDTTQSEILCYYRKRGGLEKGCRLGVADAGTRLSPHDGVGCGVSYHKKGFAMVCLNPPLPDPCVKSLKTISKECEASFATLYLTATVTRSTELEEESLGIATTVLSKGTCKGSKANRCKHIYNARTISSVAEPCAGLAEGISPRMMKMVGCAVKLEGTRAAVVCRMKKL